MMKLRSSKRIRAPGKAFNDLRVPIYDYSKLTPNRSSSIYLLNFAEFRAGVLVCNKGLVDAQTDDKTIMVPLFRHVLEDQFSC